MKRTSIYLIGTLMFLAVAASAMYAADLTLTLTFTKCAPNTGYATLQGAWSNVDDTYKTSNSLNGQSCQDVTTLIGYVGDCGPSCCCVTKYTAAGTVTIDSSCAGPIGNPNGGWDAEQVC